MGVATLHFPNLHCYQTIKHLEHGVVDSDEVTKDWKVQNDNDLALT